MLESIYILIFLHILSLGACYLRVAPARHIRHGSLWFAQILLTEWPLLPIAVFVGLSFSNLSFVFYALFFLYPLPRKARNEISAQKKIPWSQLLFNQLFPFRPPSGDSTQVPHLSITEVQDAHDHDLHHDLYSVPSAKALLIHLHGGAWKHGSSKQLSFVFRFFLRKNINVLSLNYPKLPDTDLLGLVNQVEKSVLQAASLFPDLPIYLYGRSAGGHLALHLTHKFPQLIKKTIALYPITDLESFYHQGSNSDILATRQLVETALRCEPNEAMEAVKSSLAKSLSPLHRLSSSSAPILLVHGENDPVVPIAQSDLYFRQAQTLQAPVSYLRLKIATHGFDALLGPAMTFFMNYLEEFLQEPELAPTNAALPAQNKQ